MSTLGTEQVREAVIPDSYSPRSFENCLYTSERAQTNVADFWLFQLPPELTVDDLAAADVKIPAKTTVDSGYSHLDLTAEVEGSKDVDPHAYADAAEKDGTAAASSLPSVHKIGDFVVKNVRYQILEVSPSEAQAYVNLWTSSESRDMANGIVYRGKPFKRFFRVVPDVLPPSAIYASASIPRIPVGYNKPPTPKEEPVMPPGFKPKRKYKGAELVKSTSTTSSQESTQVDLGSKRKSSKSDSSGDSGKKVKREIKSERA